MATEFYLGRWGGKAGAGAGEDARIKADRFTTHAVVIGMTGSGKTGLLVDLLEEAALEGIPALVIDPKGDLTNRLLVFPDFRPEEFKPYCPAGKEEETAGRWKANAASWGIDDVRIRALSAGRVTVFTPGSSAAPINVLERFSVPEGEDEEGRASRALGAASSLFALAGMDGDASTAPEGLLLTQILLNSWSQGLSPSLEDLVGQVLNPPFQKLGALSLDVVLPGKDRTAFAMKLNALLASPALASWRQGPGLDLDAILGSEAGASQTLFTLPHLSEGERLFFLGLLLSELAAWTRRQRGSDSLRALVVFDEVFGFFPPHPSNPPTKGPLLTLLKQARAFGVGLVLCSQNPVDLDYKGLTNAGLWFLGRLQTEPDRKRVADALGNLAGGTSAASMLGDLPPRTFLVHDVRQDAPRLLETRACISYLAGPLAGPQLRELLVSRPGIQQQPRAEAAAVPSPRPQPAAVPARPAAAPILPAGWDVSYCRGAILTPHLFAEAEIACRPSPKAPPIIDRRIVAWPLGGSSLEACLTSEGTDASDLATSPEPPAGATLDPAPAFLGEVSPQKAAKAAAASLALRFKRELLRDPLSDEMQEPDETEASFRARIAVLREPLRAREEEKLCGALARQLATAQERVRKLELELQQEKTDSKARTVDTFLSAGMDILGKLMGSRRSVGGAISRTISKGRMATRARGEVAQDEADLDSAKRTLEDLSGRLQRAREEVSRKYSAPDLETVTITPLRTGVQILSVKLLFAPRR